MTISVLIFVVMLLVMINYLGGLKEGIKFNKEDVGKLRQRMKSLEAQLNQLRLQLRNSDEPNHAEPEASLPAEIGMVHEFQQDETNIEEEFFGVGIDELEIIPEGEVSTKPEKENSEPRPVSSRVSDPGQEFLHSAPVARDSEFDKENSWEQILAGKWLSWLGAVTFIIGAGFFIKYTIDMGWIGPRERVLIGLATGLLAFAGGVWAKIRDYGFVSQGLVGTAMGILYFSIFAAVEWYQLVPVPIGLTGLMVVTGMTLAFALWSNTQVTALIGMFGGYLTPLMLWPGEHSLAPLFSYLFVLNSGILLITTRRQWSWLQLLSLGGTTLAWVAWLDYHYDPAAIKPTFLWMSVFFVQFVLLSVWNHLIQRRDMKPLDLVLMLATPFVFLGGYLWITQEVWRDSQGLLSLAMALVYCLMTVLCWYRVPENKQLIQVQAGIALSFFILAVPLHFDGYWIPLLWTVQSLLLIQTGFRMKDGRVRLCGLALLAIVQLFLFGYTVETFSHPVGSYWKFVEHQPETMEMLSRGPGEYTFSLAHLFNERSFCFFASLFSFGLLAWEYRRRSDNIKFGLDVAGSGNQWMLFSENQTEEFLRMSGLFAQAWLITFFVLCCNEGLMVGKMMAWIPQAYPPVFSALTGVTAFLAWGYFSRWRPHRGLAMVYLLMALGVCSLFIGGMYTLLDWKTSYPTALSANRYYQFWICPVLNLRFLGHGALVAVAIWFCCRAERLTVLFKDEPRRPEDEISLFRLDAEGWRKTFGLYAFSASLALLTLEAYAIGVQRDWGTATSLSITAVWTGYGLVLLLLGIARKSVNLRTVALTIFLLTTVKVYLHDVWYLDKTIRTLAFMGLGVVLLFIPWLYKRYRHRLKKGAGELPQKT
ncbi:DUF2339 domain-containing protein [Polystyrenella longa]|uniref:DUF2339 domain-containing protein n=1 Tax=Polystyrenella longa TaxID=2528007 RepID=UPI0018D23DE8|nr:DUF2339 domain-containing protein [Polystyrenella longa]